MSISSFLTRLRGYQQRHGFRAMIPRARLALRRTLFENRVVVFYCDLAEQTLPAPIICSSLKIDCLNSEAELSQQDLKVVISFWNPKLALRNMKERFAEGASLWLVKSGNRLAGYGWTLRGRTIQPYYFPLGRDDAHLFDFHVFPQYRGQGINPFLVGYIVHTLATDCGGRAFIEAAEWNESQLHSLQKTPFRRFGLARSFTVFGHKFTSWTEGENPEQVPQTKESRDKVPAMARSHER